MIRTHRWVGFACTVLLSAIVSLAGLSAAHAETNRNLKGNIAPSGSITLQGNTTPLNVERHLPTAQSPLLVENNIKAGLIQINLSARKSPESTETSTQRPRASGTKPAQHTTSVTTQIAYVVKPGDTLWQIAQDQHTTVRRLKASNQLYSDVIYPGQTLSIHRQRSFAPASATSAPTPVALTLTRNGVPSQFISIYQAAGQKYGVPWTILAAIHREETDFGSGAVVSPAGAEGPMQFMPSTFQTYGVAAPGHSGPPDINDVEDAIYSCAHMLAADGYNRDPSGALYLYDHSYRYVESVQSFARAYEA